MGILILVGVFKAAAVPEKTRGMGLRHMVRLFELKTCREIILICLLDGNFDCGGGF